jgi:hypothetical protein
MRKLRQMAWTHAQQLTSMTVLLLLTLLLSSASAACVNGATCACTSDATCIATNSSAASTATVFATSGRCDALGVCRLASGFACGGALTSNDSNVLAFVANDFECHAANAVSVCSCGGSLASCSVLDDAARSLTCSADSLTPSDACPLFACVVAEVTTTTTTTTSAALVTTTADSCRALPGCFECQERSDCLYCGVGVGCVERSLCTNTDPMSHVCEASFWNDTTTAIIAAVIVAGVLVLILCVVAAITTQHNDEPVQDPFVLEMRSVSENDRIALVKKDLLAAEAAEKSKISAADASEDSALTESA